MSSLSVINGDLPSVSNAANNGDFQPKPSNAITDWLGILASVACAIHCAAMPFVIAFLPMLGLSFLADEAFHKVMVGVCSIIALAAFVPGWRLHRRWLPVSTAVAGLSVIGFAAFALEDSCECCTLETNSQLVSTQAQLSAGSMCTDENCEHCAKSQPAVPELAATPDDAALENETTLMAGVVPWVTPLGGFLLVCAHLINRSFSCRCGCCPTTAASSQV